MVEPRYMTLDQLRVIAMNIGVTQPNHISVSRKDLEALATVAAKNTYAAKSIAARINAKIGASDVFDMPAPASMPETKHITCAPDTRIDKLEDNLSVLKRDLIEQQRAIVTDLDLMRQMVETATARAADMAQTATARATETVLEQVKSDLAQLVTDQIAKLAPTRVEYAKPGAPTVDLGAVHEKTPHILKALQAGVNVYLHGPAGSGKTTVAQKCATAFGVQFYFAAKVESEYLLIGFKDARGETVRTQFREAYEHGGVFLFDEIDASAPAAIVALNAALANGVCPFPDGIVKRHANFYCIAAGNTKLTGANRQYTGRAQMDAASIDRFAFIEFGYDEKLERALANNQKWCTHVQALRAAVAARGINHLITPRATLDGCKLLDAGFDWSEVETMVCFKGLEQHTIDAIKSQVGETYS